jgi:hypothetical protein
VRRKRATPFAGDKNDGGPPDDTEIFAHYQQLGGLRVLSPPEFVHNAFRIAG